MTFAGDMPEGALAQLMMGTVDRLVAGAAEAAACAADEAGAGDTLAIAVSCVGRRLVLGERTEEETVATLETLPAGRPRRSASTRTASCRPARAGSATCTTRP